MTEYRDLHKMHKRGAFSQVSSIIDVCQGFQIHLCMKCTRAQGFVWTVYYGKGLNTCSSSYPNKHLLVQGQQKSTKIDVKYVQSWQ